MIRLAVALGLSALAYNLLRLAAEMSAPKHRCVICRAEMADRMSECCEWHWSTGGDA